MTPDVSRAQFVLHAVHLQLGSTLQKHTVIALIEQSWPFFSKHATRIVEGFNLTKLHKSLWAKVFLQIRNKLIRLLVSLMFAVTLIQSLWSSF